MKATFSLTLGAATALSAIVIVGAGIELPISEACAAPPKPPQVSFSDDVLPPSGSFAAGNAICRAARGPRRAAST